MPTQLGSEGDMRCRGVLSVIVNLPEVHIPPWYRFRYGYRVKAKNAHCLSDVSNFARIDTRFLSGNTANATMRHIHGPHRSTQKHPETLRITTAGA